MSNVFAASEIVELGIRIEINGKDFYNALSRSSKNKKTKKLFEYLAGEEEKHIKTFQEIMDSVHKYEPKEAYPAEYFAYMNSLADMYVFTQKGKGAEIAKSIEKKPQEDAIDFGITFEKDSVTFYEGMKKIVPKKERDTIDKLISEEEKHVKQLTELNESAIGGV